MKNTLKFALVGALLAVAAPVASADCYKVSKQVAKGITAQPEQVLAIVAKQIAANKGCACEIVKAAIVAIEADKKQVAQIVEQAIVLVPNKASLLTTCALAVAPDAHVEVMKVAAKYTNKNTGDSGYSAKGGDGYSSKGGSDEKSNVNEDPQSPFADPINFIGLDPSGNFQATQLDLPPAQGGGGGQVTPGDPYSR